MVHRDRVADDRGAIAVLVAVFALVMFGLAAIVVDLGMLRVTKADIHAAADAASLAGAAALYDEPSSTPQRAAAVAAVKDSAEHNGTARSEWDSCTAVVNGPWVASSSTSCIMFDSASSPRRVRVIFPARRVNAAFGGLLGYSGTDITAESVAQARDRNMQDCSLCIDDFLDVDDDGDVLVDGDGSIMARDGEVDSGATLRLTQAAEDAGGGIGFEDWPPSPNPPSSRYSPQPERAAHTDPFAGAELFPPGNNISSVTCGSGSIPLDRAYRNVTITGSCNLNNGVLFVGRRLRVNSGATLTGNGLTIYVTCRDDDDDDEEARRCSSSGSDEGWLEVRSGGRISLTGGRSIAAGRYISLFYDPNNDRTANVRGTLQTSGSSVYLREATLSVTGSANVGGLVSVEDLRVGVNDNVAVSATGLGSRPGPFRIALVE
jgi:hypothetical protein